ncbi:MAG TPA: LamG-like jellyroll fold domain-containing protein, partial [Pirellulaceae bacterium]|nr:LamG-like jellyroll fold domain-containing protein [Pirellulaceae bacterium]
MKPGNAFCARLGPPLRFLIAAPLIWAALAASAWGQASRTAQNDTDDDKDRLATPYAEIVRADQPVAWWRFDDGQPAGELNGQPWQAAGVEGPAKLAQPGSPAAKFPLFAGHNQAVLFSAPASLRYDDPGVDSPLDFAQGDTITLEAWVSPAKLEGGQQIYVVGKGRTGNTGFAADNQNWALRLAGQGGSCRISFLFRGAENRKGNSDDWHRWTSDSGFAAGSGWHYVAVSYTFGKGDSVRGYVDGRESKGTWDYGGKSDEAPVVDDDQVWIGSASKNNPGNSFAGGIDEVAIYRTALSAERIAARWKAILPKPYVTNVPLPKDEVLVEVLEGLPDAWTWDFVPPTPSERFTQAELAFVEVPRKYTNHGVIDDRSSPFVLWAHTQIDLPAGKHRLLLRSRHAARLYIDDKLAVENPFPNGKTDGHNPWEPVESKISSRIRPLQPGDQEKDAEIELAGGPHHFRLEIFVGGKKRRPELGETSVAIAPAGTDDFHVLTATASFPLTDEAWKPWEEQTRANLVRTNQARRAAASADYAQYWDRRHDFARHYAVGRVSNPSADSIDQFIDATLAQQALKPAPLTGD